MINIAILKKSFGYGFEGILYTIKHDQNVRFHFVSAILVIIFSILFHVNAFEMGILAVMIVLVIVVEMINTTIEKMVDLITIEHRKEAKIAKDVAAGMVLITAIGSLIVGILIFAPYILRLFH